MVATLEDLAEQALRLPSDERARLAELLVESLASDPLGPIDRQWLAEATRRREDLASGRVTGIPGEEALRRVRDALGQ